MQFVLTSTDSSPFGCRFSSPVPASLRPLRVSWITKAGLRWAGRGSSTLLLFSRVSLMVLVKHSDTACMSPPVIMPAIFVFPRLFRVARWFFVFRCGNSWDKFNDPCSRRCLVCLGYISRVSCLFLSLVFVRVFILLTSLRTHFCSCLSLCSHTPTVIFFIHRIFRICMVLRGSSDSMGAFVNLKVEHCLYSLLRTLPVSCRLTWCQA